MSWKGITKGIARAPQRVKEAIKREGEKDLIYKDANDRFEDLEKDVKNLHEYAQSYANNIMGMLDYQISFAKTLAELYLPISGRVSDLEATGDDGGSELGIKACRDYQVVVNEIKEAIAPELTMIKERVVQPAEDLLKLTKLIGKTGAKRDRKRLDYERYTVALEKVKAKTPPVEKDVFAAEQNLKVATDDYEFFNDLLKKELPIFFKLKVDFVEPLFKTLYFLQLSILYVMHDSMDKLDIEYFDFSNPDIQDATKQRLDAIDRTAEQLKIVTSYDADGKGSAWSRSLAFGRSASQSSKSKYQEAMEEKQRNRRNTRGSTSSSVGVSSEQSDDPPPPPYSAKPDHGSVTVAAHSLGTVASVLAAAKAKPPPPKPKPTRLSAQTEILGYAIALFPYEAQTNDDLTFTEGMRIAVVKKTKDSNGWWRGQITTADGQKKEGQFPANYIKLETAD